MKKDDPTEKAFRRSAYKQEKLKCKTMEIPMF